MSLISVTFRTRPIIRRASGVLLYKARHVLQILAYALCDAIKTDAIKKLYRESRILGIIPMGYGLKRLMHGGIIEPLTKQAQPNLLVQFLKEKFDENMGGRCCILLRQVLKSMYGRILVHKALVSKFS
ncbi:hypothetical protein AMTRI_Chr07g28540 [Amborella trichopoda]